MNLFQTKPAKIKVLGVNIQTRLGKRRLTIDTRNSEAEPGSVIITKIKLHDDTRGFSSLYYPGDPGCEFIPTRSYPNFDAAMRDGFRAAIRHFAKQASTTRR